VKHLLPATPGPASTRVRSATPRAWLVTPLALALALFAMAGAHGQQRVPFENGIPVAPLGLEARRLPTKPMVYDTGEGQKIRVVVVTRRLTNPWSLVSLPDGSLLVTEREGRLRVIRKGVLDPKPIAGAPVAYGAGVSGLPGAVHGYMDVVLHPRFAENGFVYLSYTKRLDEKRTTVAIARGHWDGASLIDTKDIFVAGENVGSASRLAFGRDSTIFMTTSGASPQDPNSLTGKVLRLRDDGSIPPDNPFVGRAGYRPEVYTLGHRSSLALAMHPGTGEIWQSENGPNGGDEINILKPGANYGWPTVSYGRTYLGAWQNERAGHAGFEPPIVYWMPSIAASGMAFYTGDRLPKWKGDVFVGSLRTGEIPGTGHLERILFNEKMEELRRESLLVGLRQRIRDIRQGVDGLLYVLTDEKEGAVLRIEPAS
jgi:aldose sugar dehydrogenase